MGVRAAGMFCPKEALFAALFPVCPVFLIQLGLVIEEDVEVQRRVSRD